MFLEEDLGGTSPTDVDGDDDDHDDDDDDDDLLENLGEGGQASATERVRPDPVAAASLRE